MSVKKIFTFLGWPILFFPLIVMWFGITCNDLATSFNGHRMPVVSDVCETKPEMISGDYIHICATSKTHLKFLVDRFPNNEGVLSIGDIFQVESNQLQRPCFFLWVLIAAGNLIGVARKKR